MLRKSRTTKRHGVQQQTKNNKGYIERGGSEFEFAIALALGVIDHDHDDYTIHMSCGSFSNPLNICDAVAHFIHHHMKSL